MACTPFQIGNMSGFACGPRKRVAPCSVPGCTRPHVALCDYELVPKKEPEQGAFSMITTSVTLPPKTCDLKLCASHKWPIPGEKDRDLCPAHRKIVESKSKP